MNETTCLDGIGHRTYGGEPKTRLLRCEACGKTWDWMDTGDKLPMHNIPLVEAIPENFEVQPLLTNKQKTDAKALATCGHCELSWDDGVSTSMTPVPSARCPFEWFHLYPEDSEECGNAECGNTLSDGDTDGICSSCALDDECECGGLGYLLNQSYEEADLPADAVPVQACDLCGIFPEIEEGATSPFGHADECAAFAAFEDLGSAWGYTFGMPRDDEDETEPGHGEYWIILDTEIKHETLAHAIAEALEAGGTGIVVGEDEREIILETILKLS